MSPEEIGTAILTAAMESAQGKPRAAQHFSVELLGRDPLTAAQARGVQLAGQHVISRMFEYGWLPGDLHQIARRRADQFTIDFLTDLVAAYVRPHPPETIDETWHVQLDEMRAAVWWPESGTHIEAFAAKQLLTPLEALITAIEALALLIQLPKLELIRPLPGTTRPTIAHHDVDAKVLGRIRGLLAKAESTSYPEEAEALSAKAQELMTKYALDRVLIEADSAMPELPATRRIWLDTPYVDAKALLVDVVTKANRCRAIFSSAFGFMTVVGDETDLAAVELLTTSLLVQATRAMIASGNQPQRSADARSRSFRKSFLLAYATRIGERLEEANATTIAESPDQERLLPVLASRQLAVDEAFDTLFPTIRNRGIAIRNGNGWDAGREAADRARLDGQRPNETVCG